MGVAKPQGTVWNACKQLRSRPRSASRKTAKGKKPAAEAADDDIPYFETDDIRVDLIKLSSGRDYVEAAPKQNALLVALPNANLDVNLGAPPPFA